MSYLAIQAAQSDSGAWQWKPLRRLTRIRRETNADRSSSLLALSSDRGVEYRPDDGGRQLPNDGTITGYWRVHPGDLVFNPMWAVGGGVAVSKLSGAVSTAYRVYEPMPSLWPRFLHYWLRSQTAIEQYNLLVRGITTFDRSVTREDLDGMPSPVPPFEIQRAIAEYLDCETARIDALIAAKRRMVDLLEERFSTWRDARLEAQPAPGVPLGRLVASIGQGVSPDAENRTAEPGEWAVLKLSAVKSGCYLPSEHKALPSTFLERSDLVPRIGDLLVTRSNTPLLVGDVCAVTEYAPRVMLCDLIYVLRLRHGLDYQYAAQALLTKKSRLQLASAARGTSQSMVKLRGEDIRAVVIPVPDLNRQRAIVMELAKEKQRVVRMTDALDKQLILLKERREALITAAVTGQLEIPEAA